MRKTIEEALKNSLTYTEYRDLVKSLLKQDKSTTKDGDASLVGYSQLNDKRMDRLDKKTILNESIINATKGLTNKQTWLVLTEGWCGDAAQNIPVINKIAELSDKIDLKLVLRDQHEELMDLFLTNGGKSIPKLIALDDDLNVLYTWGPRPSIATKMVADFKAEHGKLTPEFKKDLQLWYTKNKGEGVMEDFVGLVG